MLDEKPLSLTEMVFNHANQNQVPIFDSGLRLYENQVVSWRSYLKGDGSYDLVYYNYMQLKSHTLLSCAKKEDVERYIHYVKKRYPEYDSVSHLKRMTRMEKLDRLARKIA